MKEYDEEFIKIYADIVQQIKSMSLHARNQLRQKDWLWHEAQKSADFFQKKNNQ